VPDGDLTAANRTPSGSQAIETILQDRGGGDMLMQTVFEPACAGAVNVHNAKGTAGAPIAVGTGSSADLSDAADKRAAVYITNTGTGLVHICGDGGAATTNDHPLYPTQTFVDRLTTKKWTAISASGTNNVFVLEVLLP
jgi:hypothetical protein